MVYKAKVEQNTKITVTFDNCFRISVCPSERPSPIQGLRARRFRRAPPVPFRACGQAPHLQFVV